MAVVQSKCGDRSVGYTGVDEDGEYRDCAHCMNTVYIDPSTNTVTHVEDQ